LAGIQSSNLGIKLNEFNFHNQSRFLGTHHSENDDSIYVYDGECPSESTYLSTSQEDFDLKDTLYHSVKEYSLMETSSSTHYPLCLIFCNTLTCNEDTL